MTESTKTLTFAGTALAVLLLALFVSRPRTVGDDIPTDLNQKIFSKFEDPLEAKSLEIVDFDEETGERRAFEVAQDAKGIWSIPSHGGYPADAERQIADAAASIIDVKKGNLESTDPQQQEIYGVVAPPSADPTKEEKRPSSGKGVGKQVTFKDKNGNVLAALIIGKEVKDRPVVRDPMNPEAPPPPPLRYVRVPNSPAIYLTGVNTSKLSTRFDDWIERDLLKMGTHKINEVTFNDYTVNIEQGALDRRGMSTLAFDSKDSKWSPVDLEIIDKISRQPIEIKLKEDEELDNQKLNDMKTALNDLRIADVQRKPAGLSSDLQANQEFMNDNQSKISLIRRGFFVATVDGVPGLYSKEGEVRCRMDDGVQYVLRFGGIAGRGRAEDLEEDKPADDKKPGDDKKDGDKKDGDKKTDQEKTADVRRFLFVAVEFDENAIPKPQLEALPAEDPKAGDKPAGPKEDAKASENKEGDKDKKEDDKSEGDKKDPADKSADDKKEDKKDQKTDQPQPVNPERERIEAANKEKQEDYDQKVKKGEERVASLNRRFADWYYVIPDVTYQKIHLTQADIIKKKAPPADQAKPLSDPLPSGPDDPFKGFPGGVNPPATTPSVPPANETTPPKETTPLDAPATPPKKETKSPAAPTKPSTPNKTTPPKAPVKK